MPPHTPTKKLQLDYKTNITQNCQKIELYISPKTTDLKKPHSSRWAGGAETQREVKICGGAAELEVPHPHVVDKNQEESSGARDPNSKSGHPAAQGSSTRKVNPHNIWL